MNDEVGVKNYSFSIRRNTLRRCVGIVAALIVALLPLVPLEAATKKMVRPQRAPPSTYVLDLSTNAARVSERAEFVRPIASLTKLMTAMVLLDAGVDLERSVAYTPTRHAAYKNWMKFRMGDRLHGRDLFLAMLVGSQNIPARMLVDLTPYAEREFVRRMNVKAAALGLSQTRFVDVHGLSPKNVSTVGEVARIFDVALRYPDIVDALQRPSVTVTVTSRRGAAREAFFHHTNTLLKRQQRFATEASKTGYLDEAGDTIAMRVRDPASGHQFIVVTLGELRQRARFPLAKRLAEQAISAVRVAASSAHP